MDHLSGAPCRAWPDVLAMDNQVRQWEMIEIQFIVARYCDMKFCQTLEDCRRMHENAIDSEARAKGNEEATERYGDALVCVRFRYDTELKQRLKTAELFVEKTDWTPPPMKYATDDLVPLRIEGYEKELRAKAKCSWWTLES